MVRTATKNRTFLLLPFVLILLPLRQPSFAYDIATHRVLGERAAQSSVFLELALTEGLGFQDWKRTRFLNKTPVEWIGEGAVFEDDPELRVLRHFHNPLRPWDQAGLLFFQSSVLWSQNPAQESTPTDLATGGGTWSWPFARQAYLRALTADQPRERERAFAETFRALGQLTHLIQDATVPPHVRDDPHLSVPGPVAKIGDPDPYEEWVNKTRRRAPDLLSDYVNAPPKMPLMSIFAATGDDRAPVPIAGLIDANVFLGGNPEVLGGTAIGAAEHTNGNFLSKDQIFTPEFLFPRVESLGAPFFEAEGQKFRRYFPKERDGESVLHFVAEGMLYDSIVSETGGPLPRAFTLTDRVQRDYAQILLPRAVGYSAALIDYFFRGRLQVLQMAFDENGVFLEVRNATDEAMEGIFELHAIYGRNTPGETRTRVAVLNGGAPAKLFPQASARLSLPVPATHRPTPDFVVVFQGKHGEEAEAVVGHVFSVPHVLVIQERWSGQLASACERTSQAGSFLPSPHGGTYLVRSARFRCEWNPDRHAVPGRILTNMPGRPAVQRIEARWAGHQAGPAPLVLDGQGYPAGVWERQGEEPDPQVFFIDDPEVRGRTSLFLEVELRNGERISTSLASFDFAVSAHGKDLWVKDPGPPEIAYLVTSGRSVSPSVAYNAFTPATKRFAFFQARVISGLVNPTDTLTFQEFGGLRIGQGVLVTPTFALQAVVDHFVRFPSGEAKPELSDPAFHDAEMLYGDIEPLQDPQTKDGPVITWHAEIARVYHAHEVDFLRAVMTAEPPPFTIPLLGTQR